MMIGRLNYTQVWEADLGPNRKMRWRIVKVDVSDYKVQKKHSDVGRWKDEKTDIRFLTEAATALEKLALGSSSDGL